jgi:hypothetical protein
MPCFINTNIQTILEVALQQPVVSKGIRHSEGKYEAKNWVMAALPKINFETVFVDQSEPQTVDTK